MTRIRTLLTSLLIGAALVGVACSDGPLGPVTVASETEAPAEPVLERTGSIEQDEVVTQTISAEDGGTISLPVSGLTVDVPPLALAADTEITITAPAGNLVGYHFEPHGLEFALPVVVMQDLSATLGVSDTTAVEGEDGDGDEGEDGDEDGDEDEGDEEEDGDEDDEETLDPATSDMKAVYFEGELESTVTPLEELPVTLLELVAIFEIRHFSGYVIATN